jgi:neutral ceramidase
MAEGLAVRLRVLACLILAVLLLLGSPARAQVALHDDELFAGFGVADITPPIGVPLAGYSNRRAGPGQWFSGDPYAVLFNPSKAVHDPIEAHAMAIVRDSRRLVFLRLDLVAVSADLIAAIRERLANLAIPEDDLIVTATHTHSGPGAWMDSTIWALVGTDRYSPEIFAGIADGGARAVREALANLVPARLFAGAFAVDGLQRNRRDRDAPVDNVASVILARSRNGAWRGGLVNFAIHPTALGAGNLDFTADIAGGIERALTSVLRARNGEATELAIIGAPGNSPVTLLFLNGALGDVSPAMRGYNGVDRIGEAIAGEVRRGIEGLRMLGPDWTVTATSVDLGAPRVALQNCASTWLRWLVGHDLSVRLGQTVSSVARLRLVRLGDVAIMTWPGEPTSSLGLELRNLASAAGARQPMVVGIAGDYLSYFTSPSEFTRNSYESCMSWFGPQGGARIVGAYRQLMAAPAH